MKLNRWGFFGLGPPVTLLDDAIGTKHVFVF